MEADINGPQRKVLGASVRPARAADGDRGIAIRDGRALPFVVERSWSAPAGYYVEQWFLIDPDSREILFESPGQQRLIWGLQSYTDVVEEVPGDFPLSPGNYQIVFALGGMQGGELDCPAVEASNVEAA